MNTQTDTLDTITTELVPTQDAAPFCINSDDRADWLLTKLAALDAEAALLKAQADAAVKRVNSDRESLLHRFGGELEAFAAQRVAQDKRGRKSIILPHGTLAFRCVPVGVKITEPDEAIRYANLNGLPDMVKVETRETLDTTRYQKAAQLLLERDGELLPGVELTPARVAFSMKFGSSGKREEGTQEE